MTWIWTWMPYVFTDDYDRSISEAIKITKYELYYVFLILLFIYSFFPLPTCIINFIKILSIFYFLIGGNHHHQSLFAEEKVLSNPKLQQMVNGLVLHMPLNMALSVWQSLVHLVLTILMKSINLNYWIGGKIISQLLALCWNCTWALLLHNCLQQ